MLYIAHQNCIEVQIQHTYQEANLCVDILVNIGYKFGDVIFYNRIQFYSKKQTINYCLFGKLENNRLKLKLKIHR
jgi:hypothetical protein